MVAAFCTQPQPYWQFLTIVSVASIFLPGDTLTSQLAPCIDSPDSDRRTLLAADSINYETACLIGPL